MDFKCIQKDLLYVLEIVPTYSNISELVWQLIPDFTTVEYNTYTRMVYSINSNSGKICIPLNEDSYKIWYSDIPTMYQVLGDKNLLNPYI